MLALTKIILLILILKLFLQDATTEETIIPKILLKSYQG